MLYKYYEVVAADTLKVANEGNSREQVGMMSRWTRLNN